MMLIIKGLLGGAVQVALFAALLLIPAGTWYWPRAIQFLLAYAAFAVMATLALAHFAPASLEARLQGPIHESQPLADRIISLFLFVFLAAWFVWIPIEVFHLKWLPAPGHMVSVVGAVLFFIGYGIMLLSIYQNRFAAPIVKDQSERGHVLIDTGLYGVIRHPLYLGFLLFLVGIGLWLESYISVLMLPVVLLILVARILVEEQTLRQTLDGYIEYQARVPFRLLPFIW